MSSEHTEALARIEKQVTPNGADTQHLGDIAQRTEAGLAELKLAVAAHIADRLVHAADG